MVETALGGLKLCARGVLWAMGFKQVLCEETGILWWINKDRKGSQRSLVLIHGFGLGVAPYVPLLRKLMKLGHWDSYALPEVMMQWTLCVARAQYQKR